jgi:hypothetical protein
MTQLERHILCDAKRVDFAHTLNCASTCYVTVRKRKGGKGSQGKGAHKLFRIGKCRIGTRTKFQQKAGHGRVFMMANEEAIHPRNRDSPEPDELLSVYGRFVAQTHDLVYAAREFETHVLGDPTVWPREIQGRCENSGRCVVRRGDIVSREKSLYRFADPTQGIVEASLGGKGLVKPREELELDRVAEFNSEKGVCR